MTAEASSSPPQKPNPFRPLAIFLTVLAAIGTGATIVGGGILISYHDLTVDDYHRRRAAGITTVVIGALLIPPALILTLMDGFPILHLVEVETKPTSSSSSSSRAAALSRAPSATLTSSLPPCRAAALRSPSWTREQSRPQQSRRQASRPSPSMHSATEQLQQHAHCTSY